MECSMESSSLEPFPSSMDVTNKPVKLVYGLSPSKYSHHLGRSVVLRRHIRHGHYARRTSSNCSSGSVHKATGPVLLDHELLFRPSTFSNSESGFHGESTGVLGRHERIGCSRGALTVDWMSCDGVKMVCEMCENPLMEKFPGGLGTTVAFTDPSVVAILACGHVFHADCLEERTLEADKCDPPCSLCCSQLQNARLYG
ncbi:hypothetical protein H6P81_010230 [Aristolochia fimbriata]|uniref:RING-type domain-containing protein n=1 Tax=Aristolochia fimbriata TaxID=158543 RepID=A0AAV7EQA8_ARIFI|nr:hypothetical protein H6P81_010230 [Aristolochia fimbriata]